LHGPYPATVKELPAALARGSVKRTARSLICREERNSAAIFPSLDHRRASIPRMTREIQRLTLAIQKARARKNARRQGSRALSLQWIGTKEGAEEWTLNLL